MRRAHHLNVSGVLINAAALVLVLSYALPYIYLLMTSIKPAADVQQIPPSFFPAVVSFENFREVLQSSTLPRAFVNSLTVAVLTTALSLSVAVPAAYVATQYRRRVTTIFLLFALVTRMVPSVSARHNSGSGSRSHVLSRATSASAHVGLLRGCAEGTRRSGAHGRLHTIPGVSEDHPSDHDGRDSGHRAFHLHHKLE
jgi:hypothetical protein